MVDLGYPFESLLRMTFSELMGWQKAAIERVRRQNKTQTGR